MDGKEWIEIGERMNLLTQVTQLMMILLTTLLLLLFLLDDLLVYGDELGVIVGIVDCEEWKGVRSSHGCVSSQLE